MEIIVATFACSASNKASSGIRFYFTRVKIGTPPREYTMMIDTGSDLSWVSCTGCETCPTFNGLGLQLQRYSPDNSSSASVISCLDSRCPCDPLVDCHLQNLGCRYSIRYADKSTSKGFFVSDTFHLDTFVDGPTSTSLIFGCTKSRSGIITSDNAVDGLLGLSANSLSLNSQLSVPRFSHCLSRGEAGGGVLVFGEILDQNIVYTPLHITKGNYYLNLQSIALNGKSVEIDPSVFKRKKNKGGTIVDSGTTFILLAVGAYDPVINSVTAVVSSFAQPEIVDGYRCFKVSPRMHYKFPKVSFNFEGEVSMIIQPKKYLSWRPDPDNVGVWCLNFESDASTIMGEVILQDKIIVYDLEHKRLGWASHDCFTSQELKLVLLRENTL